MSFKNSNSPDNSHYNKNYWLTKFRPLNKQQKLRNRVGDINACNPRDKRCAVILVSTCATIAAPCRAQNQTHSPARTQSQDAPNAIRGRFHHHSLFLLLNCVGPRLSECAGVVRLWVEQKQETRAPTNNSS